MTEADGIKGLENLTEAQCIMALDGVHAPGATDWLGNPMTEMEIIAANERNLIFWRGENARSKAI